MKRARQAITHFIDEMDEYITRGESGFPTEDQKVLLALITIVDYLEVDNFILRDEFDTVILKMAKRIKKRKGQC